MRFRVEFKFTGCKRKVVATALGNYFENCSRHKCECDNLNCEYVNCRHWFAEYIFNDSKFRQWTLSHDMSVRPEMLEHDSTHNRYEMLDIDFNPHRFMNELKTPVLDSDNFEDLAIIYDVLLILKSIGCVVNETCAVHIHLDAPLVEDILGFYLDAIRLCQSDWYEEFNISTSKIDNFVRPFMESSAYRDLTNFNKLEQYIRETNPNAIIDNKLDLKHFILNFGAIKEYGTLEFRAFNGTLNYDEFIHMLDTVIKFDYYVCMTYIKSKSINS